MKIYRWLLRLAAPLLSRDYGDAMEETFQETLRSARGLRRLRSWRRELVTLAALAWSERFWARESAMRRRQRIQAHAKAGHMDTLGQEIRQAARRLWRSPAFTAASVLTLALAIGANASIFAVVERVVINPLPYPESDRLITLDHGSVAMKIASGMANSPGLYFLYRARAKSLESAALYQMTPRTLSGSGEPERLRGAVVTPSLASVLRVTPAVGRWFVEDEGLPGGARAAVLSNALWSRRFNGDPAIIGRTVILDGLPFDVVGIMPAGFAFPEPVTDVWIPWQLSPAQGFGYFGGSGVARLKSGATLTDARAEMQALIGDIANAYPGDPLAVGNVRTRLTATALPLKDSILGGISRALWILLVAVGVVLLVACLNVANLFMVRAEERHREVAIRRALGAASFGLGRFFFTESALLAATGGALGLFIAWGALRALVRTGPALPRLHEISLQPVTIAYVAVLIVIAAIVFGAIPLARQASSAALHDSGRGNTASRRRHHVRHLLLGVQVAMALVLLVASALMVRSFQNLRAIDPGFNADSTLTFNISLPRAKYTTIDQMLPVHQGIIDRVAALPGVVAASATTCLPLSMGCNGNTLLVEGEEYPSGTLPPLSLFRAVAGGYFETMGMRIVRGRAITRDDVNRKERVVVISQKLAATAFHGRDPIGHRVASNQPPDRNGTRTLEWFTVVGVVADTPMRALNEPTPNPMTFMPLSLANGVDLKRIVPTAGNLSFVVRTATPPLSIASQVRAAVHDVDRDLAIATFSTLQALLDRSAAQMTFTMVLLAIAASISLVLGVIGIYGVTSYIVSQRTSEIGVRLALGAEPAGITSQIVKQGGLVTLSGIAAGLVAAAMGGRLIASVLYGVSPRDPAIFATMAVLLLSVALVACWLPARRASRLSPTIALRTE